MAPATKKKRKQIYAHTDLFSISAFTKQTKITFGNTGIPFFFVDFIIFITISTKKIKILPRRANNCVEFQIEIFATLGICRSFSRSLTLCTPICRKWRWQKVNDENVRFVYIFTRISLFFCSFDTWGHEIGENFQNKPNVFMYEIQMENELLNCLDEIQCFVEPLTALFLWFQEFVFITLDVEIIWFATKISGINASLSVFGLCDNSISTGIHLLFLLVFLWSISHLIPR